MTSNSAAIDLVQLEAEAKSQARNYVANLLQRPDQLEKVDQYKKRLTRKKGAVEAQLKTAVQSQLDGVRTGLNQLHNALEDVKEIKKSMSELEDAYSLINGLGTKLTKLREENSRHTQLAAAVENLKHIFTVPESVKKCEDLISDGKLLHAHKCLTDLETSRDELLFELHKQPSQIPTDIDTVNHYFSEVEKLSDSLGKQLWLIIGRTIITVRREPTIIVTVLRIIEREERIDAVHLKRHEQSGFIPPGRPKRWRDKCFEVLDTSVQNKIEGSQLEDRHMNKMWLVRHLELIRQTVVEDLRVIKTLCEPCFPPSYDIINSFVLMFHNAISQHLTDMISIGLEGNEIVSLLGWLNIYWSKEMMGNPELQINVSTLGPLLETSVLVELQELYLKTMRRNFQEWMGNSLVSDMKDWYKNSAPESDVRGFYFTALPVILFQMIEQNLIVAETLGKDMVWKVLDLCIDELAFFAKTYRGEINNYKERHALNRNEPEFFLHYLIANINNCATFVDLAYKIKDKQGRTMTRNDRFDLVAEAFDKMAWEGSSLLLSEVFIDLETHVKDLLTRNWLTSGNAIDTICITLEDYCQDFAHLNAQYYERLMLQAQKKVLVDYLKALFSKKISFKNYEERKLAAEKIVKEGEQCQAQFAKLSAQDQSGFDVLPMLAEVLKLRDTSMMSLELSGLISKYPDLRGEQLINLLLTRGDIGRNDARQMVTEVLGEDDQLKAKQTGIFTDVAEAMIVR